MDNINFQPIFDYIDQTKEELLEQLVTKDELGQALKPLQDSLDFMTKKYKDNSESITILQYKSEKLENWATQVAEKTDIPYEL